MAKLSSINKNEARKKLVAKTAPKLAKLKAIAADTSVDETERLIARSEDGGAAAQRQSDPHPQPLRADRPLAALIIASSACRGSCFGKWATRA